jgi:hypothetical protein
MKKTLIWLFAWGAAFGYLEAAVVVYLRAIYYPEGFAFPLTLIEGHTLWTEAGREAATLLVLAATAVLASPRLQSRMAAFVLLFGVWDVFYYVFLKLLIGWPQSLVTWDILFLIPAPWVGPVYAPLLVSALFIAAGTAVLVRNAKGNYPPFDSGFAAAETAAGLLIVASFLLSGRSIGVTGMPEPFAWPLFAAGCVLGAGAFLYAFSRGDRITG